MYPKLVYQHQNWPSPCIWTDLYCSTWVKPFLPNVHSDQLIYLFVFNWKMSTTKVTKVSFGTPKDWLPKNLKMILPSIRSWKPQFRDKSYDYFQSLFILSLSRPLEMKKIPVEGATNYEILPATHRGWPAKKTFHFKLSKTSRKF